MSNTWSPTSWRAKPAAQALRYPDAAALEQAISTIGALPPLVTALEIEALRQHLGDAASGRAFLLQGGDCAERFEDCNEEAITNKVKILLQMSLVLVHATHRPVIRVGRIAGQYAKPRSADLETRGDITLPAYRGDLINRIGWSLEERTPDPELMLRGYERAALSLNLVRALADGGFSDLHHPENWNLDFAAHSELGAEYGQIVGAIKQSIAFMEAITGVDIARLRRIDLYTSHEALALDYEVAQTKAAPGGLGHYLHSTHFPWIGMRTAAIDGAHVEYCRGIRNPIGIKIGPAMTESWLLELLDVLNPGRDLGRITLIHRMGASQVAEHLPRLIRAVQRAGHVVVWCSDPMHGNTEVTKSGIKTRRFDNIARELESSFEIHHAEGSRLAGVHIELTGENVTECIGGARGLQEHDLERDYRSLVDPRLNCEQALELALLLARKLRDGGLGTPPSIDGRKLPSASES